jgi:ATP-dependent DNA ligase
VSLSPRGARPAVLIVFDVIECKGVELASQPLGMRRRELVFLRFRTDRSAEDCGLNQLGV